MGKYDLPELDEFLFLLSVSVFFHHEPEDDRVYTRCGVKARSTDISDTFDILTRLFHTEREERVM